MAEIPLFIRQYLDKASKPLMQKPSFAKRAFELGLYVIDAPLTKILEQARLSLELSRPSPIAWDVRWYLQYDVGSVRPTGELLGRWMTHDGAPAGELSVKPPIVDESIIILHEIVADCRVLNFAISEDESVCILEITWEATITRYLKALPNGRLSTELGVDLRPPNIRPIGEDVAAN